MDSLVNAFETFSDRFSQVAWRWLALALCVHLLRLAARSRAWRNVLQAAYPDQKVRWRTVFSAYVAGVGVNAVLPARGGDAVKLYLVHRRIEGATYPTLVSSLFVETIFDVAVASVLLAWALWAGVLPGLDVLPRLPSIDWLWIFQHPRLAAVLAGVALVGGFALGVWAARAGETLRRRLAQGVAVLGDRGRYLRSVAYWQAVDWTLRFAGIGLFLHAFGLPVGLENAARVQAAQTLSTLLPLTPSGIGTEQALLVYVLRGEAGTGAILSFSVGMRIVIATLNVALAALVVLAVLRTTRFRRLLATATSDAKRRS